MAGWALAVSIASLVVAFVALLSSRSQWRRSGPEILVITRVAHGGIILEVVNSGRLPTVIREAGIARAGHGRYPLVPMDGRRAPEPGTRPADHYPVTIPPTGFFMAAWDAPWAKAFSQDEHRDLREIRGYAIRGDGRTFYSTLPELNVSPIARRPPGGDEDPNPGDQGEDSG